MLKNITTIRYYLLLSRGLQRVYPRIAKLRRQLESTTIILIEGKKEKLHKALNANICKYCAIVGLCGPKFRNANEITKLIYIAYLSSWEITNLILYT